MAGERESATTLIIPPGMLEACESLKRRLMPPVVRPDCPAGQVFAYPLGRRGKIQLNPRFDRVFVVLDSKKDVSPARGEEIGEKTFGSFGQNGELLNITFCEISKREVAVPDVIGSVRLRGKVDAYLQMFREVLIKSDQMVAASDSPTA